MIQLVHLYANEEFLNKNSGEALGIAYIASYLNSKGYDVDVIDEGVMNISEEDIIRSILGKEYTLVAFSLSMTNFSKVKRIVKKLRDNGFRGHITYGGHFPTLAYNEVFHEDKNLDSIILSEGEFIMLELLECLIEGKSIKNIQGIVYKNEKGELIVNNSRSRIKNIDELPFPRRANRSMKTTRISSSRGCYGDCSYCSMKPFYNIKGEKIWIHRSSENVLKEIDILVNEYGINHLIFVDDNFIGPGKKGKKRAEEIAEGLINRNYDLTFDIECRANDIEKQLFKKMKEAGLHKVFVGIESGNESDLILYNKKVTSKQNLEACKILYELGIFIEAGFILLNPYSTLEKVKSNLMFLKKMVEYNALSPLSTMSRISIMPRYKIYNDLSGIKKLYFDKELYQYNYLINNEVELYYSLIKNSAPKTMHFLYKEIRTIKNEIINVFPIDIELYNKAVEVEKQCFILEIQLAEKIVESIEHDKLDEIIEITLEINKKIKNLLIKYSVIKSIFEKYKKMHL